MYGDRFLALKFMLAAVAAAALVAFFIGAGGVFGDPVRVQTEYRDAPALSTSSSVKDARARYGPPSQTIDGEQLGLPAGSKCDVFNLADGVSLLCY